MRSKFENPSVSRAVHTSAGKVCFAKFVWWTNFHLFFSYFVPQFRIVFKADVLFTFVWGYGRSYGVFIMSCEYVLPHRGALTSVLCLHNEVGFDLWRVATCAGRCTGFVCRVLTSLGLFSGRITLFVNRNVNSLVRIYVANGTGEKSRLIVFDWFLFYLGSTATITYVLM